jgi:hypothetical protein
VTPLPSQPGFKDRNKNLRYRRVGSKAEQDRGHKADITRRDKALQATPAGEITAMQTKPFSASFKLTGLCLMVVSIETQDHPRLNTRLPKILGVHFAEGIG